MQLLPATYTSVKAITKSDTTPVTCRAILVNGAGDVAVSIDQTTAAVTIVGVAAGALIPLELNGGRIMSTNTSATNIFALQ
jgi:hypothetical protein